MTDQSLIANLDADFIPKVQELKLELYKQTGYEWVVPNDGGRRTIAEQNEIFAEGRTIAGPGVDAEHPLGRTVTKAKGGESPHNFGLAVDMIPIAFSQNGGQLFWGAPESLFKQAADIAQKMGFKAGYYFKSIHDPDHFEDTNWKQQQAKWRAGEINIA